MRARVKVTDLTFAQWNRLQARLLADYDISPGAATVCAVFELAPQMEERHIEMPVMEFAALLGELAVAGQSDLVRAVLTPDALPDHLEAVRNAADPIRTYADGCQSYGPYANESVKTVDRSDEIKG